MQRIQSCLCKRVYKIWTFCPSRSPRVMRTRLVGNCSRPNRRQTNLSDQRQHKGLSYYIDLLALPVIRTTLLATIGALRKIWRRMVKWGFRKTSSTKNVGRKLRKNSWCGWICLIQGEAWDIAEAPIQIERAKCESSPRQKETTRGRFRRRRRKWTRERKGNQ